jgi:hypothetical protein
MRNLDFTKGAPSGVSPKKKPGEKASEPESVFGLIINFSHRVGSIAIVCHFGRVVPPPSNRVLTIVKEVEQTSGSSPEDISWREEWRSTDAETVSTLLKKFGDRPGQG